MKPIINLQSGKRINLINTKLDDITINDIARGLANKGHYGGHTPEYFSIAEHSILVSYITKNLQGLLHDASEAYIGDMLTPIKDLVPDFVQIENNLMDKVMQKFNLQYDYDEVKYADTLIKGYEWIHFFKEDCPFIDRDEISIAKLKYKLPPIEYFHPEQARLAFIYRYYEIENGENKNL